MSNHWTEKHRKAQSRRIHEWKPWEKSTGAKTPEGKKRVSQNGLKHGGRSAEAIAVRRLLHQMEKLEREARSRIPDLDYS